MASGPDDRAILSAAHTVLQLCADAGIFDPGDGTYELYHAFPALSFLASFRRSRPHSRGGVRTATLELGADRLRCTARSVGRNALKLRVRARPFAIPCGSVASTRTARSLRWPRRRPCACSSSPATRRSTRRAVSSSPLAPAGTKSPWPTRSTSASSSRGGARRCTSATARLPTPTSCSRASARRSRTTASPSCVSST